LAPAVEALTFDLFGTILDLGGSLTPALAAFLKRKRSRVAPARLWDSWRARQRLEQYQDSLLMLGHSGYLETARRALVYSLEQNGVDADTDEVAGLMVAWRDLNPFPDVAAALRRLEDRFRLVVLSNGETWFLEHLVRERVRYDFDSVISVNVAGVFKPHPAVYRSAAGILGLEPGQIMMVSSNSFDVLGARACGYRGAYVNRYGLPYEDMPYKPDVVVRDFTELERAI
jgi:2-haloacid dehalogenase